ncbi:MAG: triose-phosphate isomerase [Clostridium sp.]|nr:triose-phosphate isomerase [Clostridium sp.]
MKKIYLGTNTKMYKSIKDSIDFVTTLAENTKDIPRDKIELFVIPSYTSIGPARDSVEKELITIGAQNMHWAQEGQFTGEISPVMLKEVGTEIIELGHSERRHKMGELDIDINKKLVSALNNDLRPLLCIGETKEQKDAGDAVKTLRIQLKVGLDGVKKEDISKIMIAYEPVWAIGVEGIPASPEYAEEIHKEIRTMLIEILGEKAKEIPILYGGSVNNDNFSDLIDKDEVDGLFIGRSAWDADNFTKIIKAVYKQMF